MRDSEIAVAVSPWRAPRVNQWRPDWHAAELFNPPRVPSEDAKDPQNCSGRIAVLSIPMNDVYNYRITSCSLFVSYSTARESTLLCIKRNRTPRTPITKKDVLIIEA
jgi:hypothetical protein